MNYRGRNMHWFVLFSLLSWSAAVRASRFYFLECHASLLYVLSYLAFKDICSFFSYLSWYEVVHAFEGLGPWVVYGSPHSCQSIPNFLGHYLHRYRRNPMLDAQGKKNCIILLRERYILPLSMVNLEPRLSISDRFLIT